MRAIYVGELGYSLGDYYNASLRDVMTVIIGYRAAEDKKRSEHWRMVSTVSFYSMAMHLKPHDRRRLQRSMLGESAGGKKMRVLTKEEALKITAENAAYFKRCQIADSR